MLVLSGGIGQTGTRTFNKTGPGTVRFAAAANNTYPAEYDDALFFADYSRDCIWVMPKGADGQPAPGLVRTFVAGAANPVNLEMGPDGNLYYADFDGGTIRRISYDNQRPTAVAAATPTTGAAPLAVSFDGRGSSDPNGDALSYAWDLDDDGAFDDATGATASWTYQQPGTYTPELRVTDNLGASDTDAVTVTARSSGRCSTTCWSPMPSVPTGAAGSISPTRTAVFDNNDDVMPCVCSVPPCR